MHNIESLARLRFPFPTPNPGQIEVIVEAVEHILAGKKHVVIEAPTGVGKSVIAKTIHLVLNDVKSSHRTGIITATKGLQDQYKKDMPEMHVLKGKSNYDCHRGASPYGSTPCIIQQRLKEGACSAKVACPYIIARDSFLKEATFRITNNAFQIKAPVDMIASDETIVDLLVCDESHELESTIVDHSAVVIDLNEAKTTLMNTGFVKAYNHVDSLFKILSGKKKDAPFFFTEEELTFISDEIQVGFNQFKIAVEAKAKENESFAPVLEYALSLLSSVRVILKGIEWIATKHEKDLNEIKPVYAADVAEDALFCKAKQFVHMSATICGFKEYAKALGLKDGEWESIHIDNPIPIANRKVVVFPMFYLGKSFTVWKDYYRLINIITNKHKGQSGIIHTPSFDLAKQIHQALDEPYRKNAIVSNNRSEIMLHVRTPGNIVISPSVFQGYDFKGDLARWQIVAKVPFGFLGDPHIKLNSQRSSDWYKRNAILKVVQMAGRVVRGVDDYGITYVADAQFLRMLENDSRLIPDWFLDSVVVAER